jgi:hypothetical protein
MPIQAPVTAPVVTETAPAPLFAKMPALVRTAPGAVPVTRPPALVFTVTVPVPTAVAVMPVGQ